MEKVLYQLYRAIGTVGYLLLLVLSPFIQLTRNRLAYGLGQRLGQLPDLHLCEEGSQPTVWIHASSVGEVQAALVLIGELAGNSTGLRFVLTTMTEQGNRVARSRLPETVSCLMAPLDAPIPVRRALQRISPDIYICLETELWPVMLTELRLAGVCMFLLNGRLSERSTRRYRYIQPFIASLLAGFHRLGVISKEDGHRFIELGAAENRVEVCGNIKYDMPADDPEGVRRKYRQHLEVNDQNVFICGSTRDGEEELLLQVHGTLVAHTSLVWIIAPRHLERLPEIYALLQRSGLEYDLYTELEEKGRSCGVIVVDCMGELGHLYSAGDFIFCGGSLVERGGHNIMEAARWGRPVYFGPHMKDFRDAAALLMDGGGGFQVRDAGELGQLLLCHLHSPGQYVTACESASKVTSCQRGAVQRQASIVLKAL